jgi:chromate transport protein ChrA
MSPGFATFIMMNNYFHDVATAMIGASAIIMWLILRTYDKEGNTEDTEKILWLYKQMVRILKFSLIWLIVGAIPRALTFRTYEWANAVKKGQMEGLVVKHIIAFLMIIAGSVMWMVVVKKIKELSPKRGKQK